LGAVGYALALGGLVSAAYWYVGYRDLPGLYNAYKKGEQEAVNLRQALEADTAQAEELEAHVAGLDGDPVELEAAVRKNKNVVREGEIIYRIELVPERWEHTAAPDEDAHETDARNPAE
jgi:cell division protein FtsB